MVKATGLKRRRSVPQKRLKPDPRARPGEVTDESQHSPGGVGHPQISSSESRALASPLTIHSQTRGEVLSRSWGTRERPFLRTVTRYLTTTCAGSADRRERPASCQPRAPEHAFPRPKLSRTLG